MIAGGVELAVLHERRAPNGATFLMGFLNGACVTVSQDEARAGTWRLAIHDLAQTGKHDSGASSARAISAPDEHGWYQDDSMDDDVSDEWLASQQPQEGR